MTDQANINATTLKRLPLPLPALSRLVEILSELELLRTKADAIVAMQAETAAELDVMFPAILDKAFKGQL